MPHPHHLRAVEAGDTSGPQGPHGPHGHGHGAHRPARPPKGGDDERSLAMCSYCPNLCLHACTVSNATHKSSLAPWAKMSVTRWVTEGHVALDADTASVLYQCTGCQACTSACKHSIDVSAVLFHGRMGAAAAGLSPIPLEAVARDRAAIERATEPFAALLDERNRTLSRAAYVPGCDVIVNDPEEVELTLAVLEALGFDVGIGPARCCGYPEWVGGHVGPMARAAAAFAEDLAGHQVVLVGPGVCAHTLRDLYEHAGAGLGIPVRPVLQVIAERLGTATFRALDERVGLHDACHLARRFGLVQAARSVVERTTGHPPVELRWAGDGTHCCGASGEWPRTNPDGAASSARAVIAMARDAGAEVLVSFDPACRLHLLAHADGLPVLSGVGLVARALGLAGDPR